MSRPCHFCEQPCDGLFCAYCDRDQLVARGVPTVRDIRRIVREEVAAVRLAREDREGECADKQAHALNRFFCGACEAVVWVDEDGCCKHCGEDAQPVRVNDEASVPAGGRRPPTAPVAVEDASDPSASARQEFGAAVLAWQGKHVTPRCGNPRYRLSDSLLLCDCGANRFVALPASEPGATPESASSGDVAEAIEWIGRVHTYDGEGRARSIAAVERLARDLAALEAGACVGCGGVTYKNRNGDERLMYGCSTKACSWNIGERTAERDAARAALEAEREQHAAALAAANVEARRATVDEMIAAMSALPVFSLNRPDGMVPAWFTGDVHDAIRSLLPAPTDANGKDVK